MDLSAWDLSGLLAPRNCLGCGEAESNPICGACLDQLELLGASGCRRCRNPAVHSQSQTCSWCDRLKVLPNGLHAFYAYRGSGRQLFHQIKYHGYWRLIPSLVAKGLGEFHDNLRFLDFECLIPIPESFSRKLTRFFNPAQRLARELGLATGLPVREVLLLKHLQRPQVGLRYEERRKNARNRFRVRRGTLPGSAILVDDVLTTGATLEAATSHLKRRGVSHIAWVTLFRTP